VAEGDNIVVSSNPTYNNGAHVVVCNYFSLVDKRNRIPLVNSLSCEDFRICQNYAVYSCVDNMYTGGESEIAIFQKKISL
jgi:hypothetical protein